MDGQKTINQPLSGETVFGTSCLSATRGLHRAHCLCVCVCVARNYLNEVYLALALAPALDTHQVLLHKGSRYRLLVGDHAESIDTCVLCATSLA